jgi:hypothetical protein
MITDDHGKGDGVVLVLSAAVLVIVIDARDVGPWGDGARGFTTKARRARRFLAGEWVLRWPRNDTVDHGKGKRSCSCSVKRCS